VAAAFLNPRDGEDCRMIADIYMPRLTTGDVRTISPIQDDPVIPPLIMTSYPIRREVPRPLNEGVVVTRGKPG